MHKLMVGQVIFEKIFDEIDKIIIKFLRKNSVRREKNTYYPDADYPGFYIFIFSVKY